LFALVVVVLLTSLLLVSERLIITEREQVETSLDALITAVASNDVTRVLTWIDSAATEVRHEAETLMPMVDVEDTGATAVTVEVDKSSSPLTAIARCQGRLRGVHRRSGVTVFYLDQVEFNWVRKGDRWLLRDFVAYQGGKPLDAVSSLRGNRPTPATR